MSVLVPFNPRYVPILWLNLDDGTGVDDNGRTVGKAQSKRPTLAQVLALADKAAAGRVLLTGSRPPPGWLLTKAPGWVHGAHHADHETPVGRYTHQGIDGRDPSKKVEVRRAAEWFGAGDYTPAQARTAWQELTEALHEAVPGLRPLASPGATGREAWLRSRSWADGHPITPPQVAAEVAELLHATSGQHRIERFAEPSSEERADDNQLWLMDGRLMYAACVRELGTAPVMMLTGDQAAQVFEANPYTRARYQVAVTIPVWWEGAGILPLAGTTERDGWEYPGQPGRTFTTWADASEVWLAAVQFRWATTFLAGMVFTRGRPLDTWSNRLLRAHEAANTLPDPTTARLVRAGIRWMLLHAIGAWHSTGRAETTITDTPMVRPVGGGWAAPLIVGGQAVWHRRVPLDGRAAAMAHPEWSAQVWGRARTRVLWAHTAVAGVFAGALTIPPAQLVSIYGDAVMCTGRPEWAGSLYDDGKPGRLRVKGFLPDLAKAGGWPTTSSARDVLMHAAETFGAPLEEEAQ